MKSLIFILLMVPLTGSADTIYHCTNYSGGTFWASATCSKHNALIDRIATVPSGMSWDQQVQIAEGQRRAVMEQANADTRQNTTDTRCAALKSERAKIWSRYSNWQYQAPEVVGPDRLRTIAIDAEQNALRCAQR